MLANLQSPRGRAWWTALVMFIGLAGGPQACVDADLALRRFKTIDAAATASLDATLDDQPDAVIPEATGLDAEVADVDGELPEAPDVDSISLDTAQLDTPLAETSDAPDADPGPADATEALGDATMDAADATPIPDAASETDAGSAKDTEVSEQNGEVGDAAVDDTGTDAGSDVDGGDGDGGASGDIAAEVALDLCSGVTCSDGNPCTEDGCDKLKGCVYLPNSATCSDGNACTIGDACQGGVCLPGAATVCDDGNPCTGQECDAVKGCASWFADGQGCDDGDLCTINDNCQNGNCLAGPLGNGCACLSDADCAASDDGKACTGVLRCDKSKAQSVCKMDSSGVPECPASGKLCLANSCVEAGDPKGNVQAMACVVQPSDEGKKCDDGNACSAGETCQGGSCAVGTWVVCDDGKACTDDSCDGSTGCVHLANAASCSDGDACTVGDVCGGGVCMAGSVTACDDGNSCTKDSCDKQKGCVALSNGGTCSDGDACTVADSCKASACVAGAKAICNDGNPCTADSCEAKSGCVALNSVAGCDDGNPCTQSDACQGGVCKGGPTLGCDDNNACTVDSCDKIKGCQAVAGNEGGCGGGGSCKGGVCSTKAFLKVVAGDQHTCALRGDSTVWCWGANSFGQLGDGTAAGKSTPTLVATVSGATDIAAGMYFSCATTASGVFCWGRNESSQCGQPIGASFFVTPQKISGPAISALAAGGASACGIDVTGAVWCWGAKNYYLAGKLTTTAVASPEKIEGLASAAQLAMGDGFGCAKQDDGAVKCWGRNDYGQLGNNKEVSNLGLPVTPLGLNVGSVAAIAAGKNRACVADSTSKVLCWGNGYVGPAEATVPIPTAVSGLTGTANLFGGMAIFCAGSGFGELKCWGDNSKGQLGNGSTKSPPNGFATPELPGTTISLAAGTDHACAVDDVGVVRCWGNSSQGQAGTGVDDVMAASPVVAAGIGNIQQIATGPYHSCLVKADGSVWCWGQQKTPWDASGAVSATAGTAFVPTPVRVAAVPAASQIGINRLASCARLKQGQVRCWGHAKSGSLGFVPPMGDAVAIGNVQGISAASAIDAQGWKASAIEDGVVKQWSNGSTSATIPAALSGVKDAAIVRQGDGIGCVLNNKSEILCWNLPVGGSALTKIVLPPAKSMAVAQTFACATDDTGTGRCWGDPKSAVFPGSIDPVQLPGLTGIKTISASVVSACALATGGLACWGSNRRGEFGLGYGAGSLQTAPQMVTATTGVVEVAVAEGRVCTRDSADNVACAGSGIVDPSDKASSGAMLPIASTAVFVDVVTGSWSSCAVTQQGNMQCWGRNSPWGLLGTGDADAENSGVPVEAVVDQWKQLSIQGTLGCGLRTDGSVWCWGNKQSNLDSTTPATGKPTPIPIPGAGQVTAVTAGGAHLCALKNDGTVWCLGSNQGGALGNGGNGGKVSGLGGVVQIGAAAAVTCAVRADGTAACWGQDIPGTAEKAQPYPLTEVEGVTDAVAVRVQKYGRAACILRKSGGLACWGQNYNQAFFGVSTNFTLFKPGADLLSDVAQFDIGIDHGCAVKTDGSLWCWGNSGPSSLNKAGLGENWWGDYVKPPTKVGPALSALKVACSEYNTCALYADGKIRCWGQSGMGQLGDGKSGDVKTFTPVGNLWAGAKMVAAYGASVVALTNTAALRWGGGTLAPALSGPWTSGAPGRGHTCYIDANSSNVGCFGPNTYGEQGGQGFSEAIQLISGAYHSCAIRSDKTLWCWGRNDSGQTGDGVAGNKLAPVQVKNLTGIIAAAAGDQHTCALKADGTVWCWGFNGSGQLGDGTVILKTTPAQVKNLTNTIGIAAGVSHTCAWKADGTAWCWGAGTAGQLGSNSKLNKSLPLQVIGLAEVASMAAGQAHTCAAAQSGDVLCWGANGSGQLGSGAKVDTTAPAIVPGVVGAKQLALGDAFSCARLADGTVTCWGADDAGQLGDGPASVLLPTPIVEGK